MWECDYAREPVNYRLFFLKLLKKIWLLPLAAVIGAVVIGGIYYVVNMVIGDGYRYRARTMYYVQYATDESGKEADYYNYYTWQELVKTEYFVDGMYEALGGSMPKEEILASITATVEADYRYLYTKSVTGDSVESINMEAKLSELMVAFADTRDEIESIEVVDKASEYSVEDVSLIYIGHAAVVGAAVGLVAVILLLIFIECVDTSIYLPATLEKRYHIVVLGAPSMKEFEANCKKLLSEKNIAIVSADGLGKEGSGKTEIGKLIPASYSVTVCDNPIDKPSEYEVLRDKNYVVIAVKAAAHNGKKIERLIEQLARQEIKVSAFVLFNEDKWLINRYYK